MPLNEQQQQVVDALDGSVNVVAGAGTGKTFTLTRRIVAAVERSLEADPDDADPTGHVLAITFTRKAAAELKSRVRQAFLDEAARGGERAEAYLRCALRIDNAWVSTIHGMASRILRENALEFGIDPSFKTLSAQGASALFSEALQLAVDEVMRSDDAELAEYIGCRDIEGAPGTSGAVASMVEEVLDVTGYMPRGVDGIVVRRPAASYREACAPLLRQASVVRRLFEEDGWPAGEAAKLAGIAEEMDAATSALEGWLDEYDAWLASGAEEGPALEGLERAVHSFPATTPKFGKKSDHYEDMARYRLEYKLTSERVAMLGASAQTAALVRFAAIVGRHMDAIKSAGHTMFTESDLLFACNERLSDPANAPILERYRRQFHCIMLDEFQDTDPLQMAIVSKLAVQPDEAAGVPPLSNVCTVGDMQQSIYRFRGGDVEETQKRIASMRQGQGRQFELSGNYRSHKHVLDAVEAVFSRPGVFGDEFLKLAACREETGGGTDAIFKGRPRVEFAFVHGRRASKDDPGVSLAETRAVAAAQVAAHFRELADKGARPSGMALLLGRMGNADVYAQALRDAGFECMVAGGSVFAETLPARLVGMLLRYAVNRNDEVALVGILTSPLVQVSDDALLALSRRRGGERPGRFALSRSLASFEHSPELDEEDNASLAATRGLLASFAAEARRGPVASALRSLLVRSGYLGSLQRAADARAMSDAGNAAKAVRIVAELDEVSCGVAEVASRYASVLEHGKEAPGALATLDSEYVKIMTVHSSKGLEFDHVALAEMRDGMPQAPRSSLISENIDGSTYLSMRPTKASFADPADYDTYRSVCAFTFEDLGLDPFGDPLEEAGVRPGETKYDYVVRQKRKVVEAETPEATHRFLSAYERLQELEEARRLMYVAMTRARESLFVSVCATTKPSSGYRGVFADVYEALEDALGAPEDGFKDSFRAVQGPLGARRVALQSKEDAAGRVAAACAAEVQAPAAEARVELPVYDEAPSVNVAPYSRSRQGLRSYTSLSKGLPGAHEAPGPGGSACSWASGEGAIVDDEFFLMASALLGRAPADESATALGTAFHRLCQASILQARQEGLPSLPAPDEGAVAAQVRACGLSEAQALRLSRALRLWLGSELACAFASFGSIAAEVPFSVVVEGEGDSFVLEGEIDGLADDGAGAALLVDYKTGSTPATQGELREKHRLQAQCYAYALLMAGYRTVEARFVRVEEEALPAGPDDVARRPQPAVVEYSYSFDDVCALRDDLLAAYRYSLG